MMIVPPYSIRTGGEEEEVDDDDDDGCVGSADADAASAAGSCPLLLFDRVLLIDRPADCNGAAPPLLPPTGRTRDGLLMELKLDTGTEAGPAKCDDDGPNEKPTSSSRSISPSNWFACIGKDPSDDDAAASAATGVAPFLRPLFALLCCGDDGSADDDDGDDILVSFGSARDGAAGEPDERLRFEVIREDDACRVDGAAEEDDGCPDADDADAALIACTRCCCIESNRAGRCRICI